MGSVLSFIMGVIIGPVLLTVTAALLRFVDETPSPGRDDAPSGRRLSLGRTP